MECNNPACKEEGNNVVTLRRIKQKRFFRSNTIEPVLVNLCDTCKEMLDFVRSVKRE